MKHILTISIYFLFSFQSYCQELIYDILLNDKKVGSMLVKRDSINENEVYYSSVSDVRYSLFGTNKLIYFYEALYKNEKLEKAYFVYKKNDEVNEEVKLLWNESAYKSSVPEKNLLYKQPLVKSMLKMYYEVPKNREEIFSERFHDFVKIGALEEENKFIFYVPNGDKNIYQYNEKGYCDKISISSGIFSFDMVLSSVRED